MSDRTEALEDVARAASRYVKACRSYGVEFRDGDDSTCGRLELARDERDERYADLVEALDRVPAEPVIVEAGEAEWKRHAEQYGDDECPAQKGIAYCWCQAYVWT